MLAFVVSGAFYSITEAGFRTMTPMWIFRAHCNRLLDRDQRGVLGQEVI